MLNSIIFIIYFIFCFLSVFGFGKLIVLILSLEKQNLNLGEITIFGFFFIFSLSLLFHLFIPLNYFFNTIFLFCGFTYFLFNVSYFKKKIKLKSKIYYIIFLALLPCIIVIRTHADYEWYHLPYINYVNNFKIIFGLANFSNNLAFGHGWQDILSLFSLSYIETRGLTAISIIFYFAYLFSLIKYIEEEEDQNIKILIQIIFFYSLAIFNKLIDFGSEAQPLMIMLLFGLNLIFFVKKNNEKFFILFFIFFIFSVFFRFGSIVFFPAFILIFLYNIKIIYGFLTNNKRLLTFIFISGTLYLLRNYIHSGCLVFPLHFTCLFNDLISWAVPIDIVIERFSVLSAISKGWAFYLKDLTEIEHINYYFPLLENNQIIHPKIYSKNIFFWPIYWFHDHDTSRAANILILITFAFLIFLITKNRKIEKKRTFNQRILFISFLLSLIFWFISSPQTRYGGYAIIGITVVYFYYFFFLKYEYNKNKNNFIFVLLISLSLFYITNKNINRLMNFDYKTFQKFPFPNYTENILNEEYEVFYLNNFTINLKKHDENKIIGEPIMCGNIKMICIPEPIKDCISEIRVSHKYVFVSNTKDKCYQQYIRNYWQH